MALSEVQQQVLEEQCLQLPQVEEKPDVEKPKKSSKKK
jgi:hypothetical protein